ncbi:hypothetical protein Emag_005188 [Eimeria magna]
MAGDMSQLSLAGGPSQSVAPVAGVEKAPDSVRLLHAFTEGAAMPHQARHPVFRGAILGAPIAYVAILSVALLILTCARRLSNLSVDEGRVRSLASRKGAEPAGVCAGNAAGGGEEAIYEGTSAWREAIVEQAEKNIRGFRDIVKKLVALKSGPSFSAVTGATSVYILLTSEMGLLGAFIDDELLAHRPLWLSVMKETIDSAEILNTGWPAAGDDVKLRDVHHMNGDLADFLGIMTSKKERMRPLDGNRWTMLSNLVEVQAVSIEITRSYLTELGPHSGITHVRRKIALRKLGGVSDIRRRMILGNWSYGDYFKGFSSRGFAKRKFGDGAVRSARMETLPLRSQEQISFLLEHFPKDLSNLTRRDAPALSGHSSSSEAPSSKKKSPDQPPEKRPKHPLPPPLQPPGPPRSPMGPPMQPPPTPPSASGPGSRGTDSSTELGAQPKSYSQAAASGSEKSSEALPWMSSLGVSRGGLKGRGMVSTIALSSTDEAPQTTATVFQGTIRLRRREGPKSKEAMPKDVTPLSEEEASSRPEAEAEGRVSEGQNSPVGDSEEELVAPPVEEKVASTAEEDDDGEKMQPLASATLEVPHGATTPPTSSPSQPSGFSGPQSFAEVAKVISHRPPRPSEKPHGSRRPLISKPSPLSAFDGRPFAEVVKQTLRRPPKLSDPLPPTSGSPSFESPLEAVQPPHPGGPSPSFPSTPLPSAPITLTSSRPSHKDSPDDSSSQPTIRDSPPFSIPLPSILGPFFASSATPGFWAPLSSFWALNSCRFGAYLHASLDS